MILRISDELVRQKFQRNFFQFLPVQKHLTKSSSADHTVCFQKQKEKTYRDHTFVNNYVFKTISCSSVTLCKNFQIRHISNETSVLKNNEQSLDIQSDILSEETIDAMMTYLPPMLKNISNWKIVELAQQCLLNVHETTGLPWWASIIFTALITRTLVTLPFSIITVQNTAKLKKVNKEMNEVVKRLKEDANFACQFRHMPEQLVKKEYGKAVSREYKEMIVTENCHPAKNFILIWVQLPLWFAFSFATRNLCYMLPKADFAAQVTFIEMSVGGLGWFPSLVIPDPYMILPIALGLTNIAVIEVHRLFRTETPSNPRLDKYATNFFRVISIVMIPIASLLPAATNIYWLTSSTFGLVQAFILQSPKLRRTCGIPLLENDKHPYRQFYSNLKSKLIILYADLVNSEIMAFPGDCTKYQLCDASGCFVFDCAPGTEFNPLVSVCDYPLSDRGSCSAMMAAAASGIVNGVGPAVNGQQVVGSGNCQKCAGRGGGGSQRPQSDNGASPHGAGNQGPQAGHPSTGGIQKPQGGGGGGSFIGGNQGPQGGHPSGDGFQRPQSAVGGGSFMGGNQGPQGGHPGDGFQRPQSALGGGSFMSGNQRPQNSHPSGNGFQRLQSALGGGSFTGGNQGSQGGYPGDGFQRPQSALGSGSFMGGNQGSQGGHPSNGGFQKPYSGGGGSTFMAGNHGPQGGGGGGNPFLQGVRPMGNQGGLPPPSGHAFTRPGNGGSGSPHSSDTQNQQQTLVQPNAQGGNCRACQNGAPHRPSGGMGLTGGDPFPGHKGHMGGGSGAPQKPAPYPPAHQGGEGDYEDPDDNGEDYNDDNNGAVAPPLKKYTPPPGIGAGDNGNTILMNYRILNKVVLQNLRYSQCRYLSVQQNINKCSSTYHTVTFHKRKEIHSSSFICMKFSNNKTLCQPTLPIYKCFQRNFSGTSRLHRIKNPDPLKDITNVAPPPSVEITQKTTSDLISPDVSDNILVEYCLQFLMQVHEATGLPWWASIVLTTFLIRTIILLPFSITQIRVLAKLEKVNIEAEKVNKLLKKESVIAQRNYGWPEDLANQKYEEAKKEAWWNLVKKENCHPMKTYFLLSMQCVTWISMTTATYILCHPIFISEKITNQMKTGGFGWITDLTEIDSYLILPFSIGLINLLLVEIHQSFKVIRRSRSEQWRCAFFRVVSIGMIPLAAYCPAAVNVYWLSSSTYGFLQAFLLNSSPVRRLFKVPANDPGLKQPYRYFLKYTKEKLRLGKGETAIVAK
ncbi:uncharacterized protein LOC131662846 [Phymastichus coffea]|uniref:uncharacterized protein LOC131662846 n=1 Tax=Phymastichus coffea TaxID=108790 RepID=UPI00273AE72A|nr:uncharacterized protein LOC131662846 [Phymastichus coffea]